MKVLFGIFVISIVSPGTLSGMVGYMLECKTDNEGS